MAIPLPTAKELEQRSKADVQQALPQTNPFLKEHFIQETTRTFALRVFDFYRSLDLLQRQIILNAESDEDFTGKWAEIKDIDRNPATQSSGSVVATGVAGSTINSGTEMQSGENTYIVDTTKSISAETISVTSLVRLGSTVTATTVGNHNLASNISIVISGAVETEYNGAVVITVSGLDTFTYEITTTPTSPATGTIILDVSFTSLDVTSAEFGQSTNLIAGTRLTLSSTIGGVDNDLFVDFNEVSGGTDLEALSDWQQRILDAFRNPVACFNVAQIEQTAKTVPGVTRVFIDEAATLTSSVSVSALSSDVDGVATATPSVAITDFIQATNAKISGANETQFNITRNMLQRPDGDIVYVLDAAGADTATGTITLDYTLVPPGTVVIYFTRDNDDNIIPSGQEVQDVKDVILSIKPAHVDTLDVIVRAPTAVTVDFTFTALTPNTSTMQAAIQLSLANFFEENTSVSVNVDEDAYRAAIFNTIATDTGERVQTFELSTPTGDIAIANGELPVLGNITF